LTTQPPTSRWRRWVGQIRAFLLTTLAMIIILTAILVGVGRALIPYADEIRPWLAQTLSDRLGQDVDIDQLEVHWPRLTPQLTLHGLRIGPEADRLLTVGQTRLEVHLPDLLSADRNPVRLVVLGLDLVVAEDEHGQWGLRLEGGAEMADRPAREQVLAGDLLVREASLRIQPQGQPEYGARLVEGEIRRRGEQTFVRGRVEPVTEQSAGLNFSLLLNHPEERWQTIEAWARADSLELDAWLAHAWPSPETRLSLEAWLQWTVDEGARLDLDVELSHPGMSEEVLRAEFLFTRNDRLTQAELISLHVPERREQPLVAGLAVANQGSVWAVAADEVDLGALFELGRAVLVDDDWMPGSVSGRIHDLSVGMRPSIGLHALSGRVAGLSATLPDPLPSIRGLDIDLALDGDRVLAVPGGQPEVHWPALLRESVALEQVQGQALLSMQSIELRGLEIENDFVHGLANGWIYLGAERPFLDFVIEAERVESIDPRPYLPPRYIPDTAMTWLDDSLLWVDQAHGVVLLHMRAGKLAREIEAGDFQAEVEFSGVAIDYWPDWPEATALAGQASFIGRGLIGQIDQALLGSLPVSAPSLSLADLTAPVLDLDLRAEPSLAEDVAELLATLPIENWAEFMAPMQWSGPVSVFTHLSLPFANMEQWWIEGTAELDGAELVLPALSLTLPQLDGVVGFDRQALGPAALASGSGQDQIGLDVSAGFVEPAWLRIDSELNPGRLSAVPPALHMLADQVQGQGRFRFDLAAADAGGLGLRIESDLTGLEFRLPPPLTKTAIESWPLIIEIELGDEFGYADIALDTWLAARMRDGPDGWHLGLALNHDQVELPSSPGIRARGSLAHLALTDWLLLLADQGDVARASPPEMDVQLELGLVDGFGMQFQDLLISMQRQALAWEIEVDGDSVDGRLTVPIPLDSGRVLVADLSRLYLDPIDPEPLSSDLEAQPLTAQTSGQSPRGLPPLHLLVEDLQWGTMNLGRARLESHAVADGVEIELVDVSGPDLRLNGRGRWLERDRRAHSEFQGRLMTRNLSGLLASAGYDSGIEAARAQVDTDLRWPGSPMDFTLSRLSGGIDLRISDGVIPEARPGAGRLLGLASFSAIPRRLMLDFRDVLAAGLKFDEIDGRFELASGFARTDGLVIRSPAATITISGDTDMAAREYDQVILVEPGLGATLPVLGVLAGGPAGAAAGLVLRSILERPLRGIAEARYSVTGSWDDPVIELVEARVAEESGEETHISSPPPD
jgi:uncharacterized protein (TIGR02099 family)